MGNRFTKPARMDRYECGARFGVIDTQFFTPTNPWVKKTSLVNFKHKNYDFNYYTDSTGTGYMSHDKELCLLYSKSINQIQTCTDAMMQGGGRVKRVVFPPKRSKYLGTGGGVRLAGT